MIKSILLIDDSEMHLRITRCFLKKEGQYHVDLSRDYQETVLSLRKRSYDLVLLDIHLEDLSGFELMDEIKLIAPGVPVILFSSDTSFDNILKAYSSKAEAIVNKYDQFNQLPQLIEKYTKY